MSSSCARRPRVAFITQLVDADDPVLGFVVAWCEELARHADLTVIANEVRRVPPSLHGSVVSLRKEEGATRWARTRRLRHVLIDLSPRPDIVFAHMCPGYLIVASTTTAGLLGRRVLWYTHPAATRTLRVAQILTHQVMTSLPGSYPIRSPKTRVLGHAINVTPYLGLQPRPHGEPLRLLALGRTSPVKGLTTLIEAVALVRSRHLNVEVDIVGPATTPAETQHREEVKALLKQRGLEDVVQVQPGLPHARLPDLLERYDVLLNATENGSADKVVFEAMAAARYVIVTNPSFEALLVTAGARDLLCERTPQGVAEAIVAVASRSPEKVRQETQALRDAVVAEHALQTLGSRVLAALDSW